MENEIGLEVYDETGAYIGEITVTSSTYDVAPNDMPKELEINGVTYYPQF